ncbi:MAG: CCRG-2 family RiPP [Synechococcus sp.]
MTTTTTDCFDTELSLDELKAITGGVKATVQTTQAAKAHNTELAATDDVFVGFGDLYGI